MESDKSTRLPENVILLDAAFINVTMDSIRHILSARIGKQLPVLDLVTWLTCMALDAGISGENNRILVILAFQDEDTLKHCRPGRIGELDGTSCRTALGEMSFSCVTGEGMTGRSDFFLDLLTVLLDDAGVRCLAILPAEETCEEVSRVISLAADGLKDREVSWFGLRSCGHTQGCTWRQVAGPLAYAWDIRDME